MLAAGMTGVAWSEVSSPLSALEFRIFYLPPLTVLPCHPGWLQTRDLPASACRVLGWWVSTTTPRPSCQFLNKEMKGGGGNGGEETMPRRYSLKIGALGK